jgi:hypothetical protein
MHADDAKIAYLSSFDCYLWQKCIFFASVFALFAASRSSLADTVSAPFYYASATAVEPQISTLLIGVNDTIGQAVVSGDRKRVTLSMDANLYDAQGIRTFTYQKSAFGFVGSAAAPSGPAAPAIAGAPATPGKLTPSIAATPSAIAPALTVLDKPGMVLVAPLGK